jgi:hypothetical protein
MSDPATFFLTSYEKRIGANDDSADELHPRENAKVEHYACTETQYLGFSIPEEGIHALNYIWHHPRMNTLLGGNIIFQGFKPTTLAAEVCDMRCFMSDKVLANGLKDFTLDNSYHVQVLEPRRKFHISYHDPVRDSHFDVTLNAIMPIAMWSSGRHFEQAMKTSGELTLRGKKYKVDGYTIRDRSWGEARSEAAAPIPATGWMTGVFNDHFAFNCNAIDHPDLNPLWKDGFTVDPEKTLIGGWVWLDGDIVPITDCRKLTHYNPINLYPRAIDLELTLLNGKKLEIQGKTTAACPFNPWINVYAPICQMEWTSNNQTGHGEVQDVQWNDFVNRYARTPEA